MSLPFFPEEQGKPKELLKARARQWLGSQWSWWPYGLGQPVHAYELSNVHQLRAPKLYLTRHFHPQPLELSAMPAQMGWPPGAWVVEAMGSLSFSGHVPLPSREILCEGPVLPAPPQVTNDPLSLSFPFPGLGHGIKAAAVTQAFPIAQFSHPLLSAPKLFMSYLKLIGNPRIVSQHGY